MKKKQDDTLGDYLAGKTLSELELLKGFFEEDAPEPPEGKTIEIERESSIQIFPNKKTIFFTAGTGIHHVGKAMESFPGFQTYEKPNVASVRVNSQLEAVNITPEQVEKVRELYQAISEKSIGGGIWHDGFQEGIEQTAEIFGITLGND